MPSAGPAAQAEPSPPRRHTCVFGMCVRLGQIKEAGTVVHRYRFLCSPARSTTVISQKRAGKSVCDWFSRHLLLLYLEDTKQDLHFEAAFSFSYAATGRRASVDVSGARREKPGPAWLVRFCWSRIRLELYSHL